VLKDGGRLALAVWSEAAANPWAAIPMSAIMAHFGAPPPPPGAPSLWALSDESQLRRLLEDAGLTSVTTELVDDLIEYESVENWMELTGRLAGPVRALLANLDQEGRTAITAAVASEARQYRSDSGELVIPERMVLASARRA
jgi:hypothetical protein